GVYNWKYAYAWWAWLRRRVDEGQPYDALVRDILLATSREGRSYEELAREVEEQRHHIEELKDWETSYPQRKTLDLFWRRAIKSAPEVTAQQVSYSFLGVRIDCAQCHKHPFDRWTQEDFWRFAAFFPQVRVGYPAAVQRMYPGVRPPF